MKKSVYKTMAEAITFGKLKEFVMPVKHINRRKMTVDEIKEHIVEEFGKAKDASKVEMQEKAKGWGDAELANEIEWAKKLELKEFFDKKEQ